MVDAHGTTLYRMPDERVIGFEREARVMRTWRVLKPRSLDESIEQIFGPAALSPAATACPMPEHLDVQAETYEQAKQIAEDQWRRQEAAS